MAPSRFRHLHAHPSHPLPMRCTFLLAVRKEALEKKRVLGKEGLTWVAKYHMCMYTGEAPPERTRHQFTRNAGWSYGTRRISPSSDVAER
eukprot:6486978-Amphidinium_carterae.1